MVLTMTKLASALILAGLFVAGSFATSRAADETDGAKVKDEARGREVLWKALLKALPEKYREIDVYAENPSLTQVVFRSQGTTLTFSLATGKVEPVLHMKVLLKVNRITFEKNKIGGWFVLWYYGQRELEIGADD